MDKNKLKELIRQVADIEDLTPKKDPSIRLDDNSEDLVRAGDEWIEVTAKSNPTLGFKFKKLKDRHAVCELGCGDIVSNQVIEKRLCHNPQTHWRTKCANCGCFVSPDGLGFIEGGHQIQAAYIKHFNGVNNIIKDDVDKTNHSEITEYGSERKSKWITDSNGNISLRDK